MKLLMADENFTTCFWIILLECNCGPQSETVQRFLAMLTEDHDVHQSPQTDEPCDHGWLGVAFFQLWDRGRAAGPPSSQDASGEDS